MMVPLEQVKAGGFATALAPQSTCPDVGVGVGSGVVGAVDGTEVVGTLDGAEVVGPLVGPAVGFAVGFMLGFAVGFADGCMVGFVDGGLEVGAELVGAGEGAQLGAALGAVLDGDRVGLIPPPQMQHSTDAVKPATSNPPQSCGFASYQFVQVLIPSLLVELSSFVQPRIGFVGGGARSLYRVTPAEIKIKDATPKTKAGGDQAI